MIPGLIGQWAPVIAPPPSSGYSFTMTAGDLFGTLAGYYTVFATGSIDAEPVPGFVLLSCIYSPSGDSSIAFEEDATVLLVGKTVWVDGVEYAANSTGWSYNGAQTILEWPGSVGAPVFVPDGTYFVEIK